MWGQMWEWRGTWERRGRRTLRTSSLKRAPLKMNCTTARSRPWRWNEPTYDFARSFAFGSERSVGATRAGGGAELCSPFLPFAASSSAVQSSSYLRGDGGSVRELRRIAPNCARIAPELRGVHCRALVGLAVARDGREALGDQRARRVALVVVEDRREGALDSRARRRVAVLVAAAEGALVLGHDADALACGGGARLRSENCAGIAQELRRNAPSCAGIAPSCARTDQRLAQRLLRLHAVRLRLVDHVAAEDARAAHRREGEAALRPPLVGDHDGVARDDFDDAPLKLVHSGAVVWRDVVLPAARAGRDGGKGEKGAREGATRGREGRGERRRTCAAASPSPRARRRGAPRRCLRAGRTSRRRAPAPASPARGRRSPPGGARCRTRRPTCRRPAARPAPSD